MDKHFATRAMGHKAGNGATGRKRQERPFLKEASNAPARNIRPKQSNVASRREAVVPARRGRLACQVSCRLDVGVRSGRLTRITMSKEPPLGEFRTGKSSFYRSATDGGGRAKIEPHRRRASRVHPVRSNRSVADRFPAFAGFEKLGRRILFEDRLVGFKNVRLNDRQRLDANPCRGLLPD